MQCSARAVHWWSGAYLSNVDPGSAAHRCTPRCARETNHTMLNFLGKRILQLIPTLFFVSILIFSLQHLLPGDPALVMAGEERDPNVIAHIRQQYRLVPPISGHFVVCVKGAV